MISVRPTARSPIWGLKILSSMNESSSWIKSSTLHKSLPKTWTLISKKMLRRKRIRYVKSCPISFNNHINSVEEKELALWFSFVILKVCIKICWWCPWSGRWRRCCRAPWSRWTGAQSAPTVAYHLHSTPVRDHSTWGSNQSRIQKIKKILKQ